MAEALVSREQLWYGRLPPVCVKTGVPAQGTVTMRFERLPPWSFLLLLAGILPFLLALLFLRERVQGEVPISEAALERYHAHTRWLWLGWGLVATGLVLTVTTSEPWLLLVTALGVALLTVTEVRRSFDRVTGVPVRGTPFVELRRVHPAFAAACADEVAVS